jgi:multiple sugar transport system ATP-binding protein
MTLGDRVAVMRSGVLQQVGTPAELYQRPDNLFVAGFIGSPAMNFMPAKITKDTVELPFGKLRLTQDLRKRLGSKKSGEVIAGVRPEAFEDSALVGENKRKGHTFKADIDLVESMGSELYAYFGIDAGGGVQSKDLEELAADSGAAEVPGGGGDQAVARLDAASKVKRGAQAELWVDKGAFHFFDPKSGKRLGGDSS